MKKNTHTSRFSTLKSSYQRLTYEEIKEGLKDLPTSLECEHMKVSDPQFTVDWHINIIDYCLSVNRMDLARIHKSNLLNIYILNKHYRK